MGPNPKPLTKKYKNQSASIMTGTIRIKAGKRITKKIEVIIQQEHYKTGKLKGMIEIGNENS